SLQIGGFQHRAHETHRLVAHVGAHMGVRDRGSDKARAGGVGSYARLRQIGTIEMCTKHLRRKKCGALEARASQICLDQPRLVEDRTIKSRSGELSLVEPCRAKYRAGQIEPG